MTVQTLSFRESSFVPNNQRFPVIIHTTVPLYGRTFESLFRSNGWRGLWTNGVFDYQHYHSAAHEALGIQKGNATLLIGGPDGAAIEVVEGDCLVLPAGTGHMNLGCSGDFQVIGAYPPGQQADLLTTFASPEQLKTILSLPAPSSDPVLGKTGGVTDLWQGKPLPTS